MRRQRIRSTDLEAGCDGACASYREALRLTRRGFLSGLGAMTLPAFLPRAVFSASPGPGDLLVCVFLRGGADGLNVVIPCGDEWYYRHRTLLAIPAPGSGGTTAIGLDGYFAFHPSLAPLVELWQDDALAVVQAVGLTDTSHSHFDAQDFLERCEVGGHSVTSGWIGRHLATIGGTNTSPFRALGVGPHVPISLRGPVPATAFPSAAGFSLVGDGTTSSDRFEVVLRAFYPDSTMLSVQARQTLDAVEQIANAGLGDYHPENGAVYPDTNFGDDMKTVAQMHKAGLGMEVACVDFGGWDTHNAQGHLVGSMPTLLTWLGQGLSAFYADLGSRMQRVTVVVMSEFGRRVRENNSGGTDHGYGSFVMLLGGGINGGTVYGSWPGLAPGSLTPEAGDLEVTTDTRTILAEVVQKRLGNSNLAAVFPGFAPGALLGVARAL